MLLYCGLRKRWCKCASSAIRIDKGVKREALIVKNAPFYGGCKVGLAKEIVSCAQQHHVAQCASCATIAIREGMYIDEVEVSDTRLEQGMKLTVSNEGNQIIHHSRYCIDIVIWLSIFYYITFRESRFVLCGPSLEKSTC